MNIIQYKTKDNINVLADIFNQIQSISIVIAIKAGGLYEQSHEFGISHFVEHMAFKGTNSMNYRQIALAFDRIGGNFNAYTTKDRTVYYAKVLKNNVYKALDILADILINSTLPEDEIEKERKVILQEIAQNQDLPDNYIFDMFYQAAFPDQPLGHDLLGSTDFVNNITKDQLVSYMQKFYTAENTTIAISGNIERDKVFKYIERKFADMPKNSSSVQLPKSDYKPVLLHKKQEFDQTHFVLGFEGVAYNSEYFYIQNLASMILGEGASSRLFERLREQQGLCYHISSFVGSYHDTGIFGVYSATHHDKVEAMKNSINHEIVKVAEGISDDEILIAKNHICSAILMSLESSTARAEKMASNHICFSKTITIPEIEEKINAITKAQLYDYFTKFIVNGKSTFVSIGA